MMKTRLKVKGHLRSYMRFSIYLGLLLLAVNAAIFLVSIQAGALLCVFTVFYFIVSLTLYYNNKPLIMNELVSFATEYGQIQKKLLKELDVPYVLLDEDGKVMWTNIAFEQITDEPRKYNKSITSIFPVITGDKLPREEDSDEAEFDIEHEGRDYSIRLKRIPLKEMAENSDLIEAEGYNGYLIAMFMFDKTALNIALQELDDQSLCVGMIYLDNFDEAMESVEEVKQSLLAALIDRKVKKYISGLDGICRKTEKDKYLVILRKKAIAEMQDKHFELLQDIKTVKLGENSMAVTTSIGLGVDGLTYAQNYEYAATRQSSRPRTRLPTTAESHRPSKRVRESKPVLRHRHSVRSSQPRTTSSSWDTAVPMRIRSVPRSVSTVSQRFSARVLT